MKWQEKFADLFTADIYEKEWSDELTSFREIPVNDDVQAFIETEIIEKIIDEIPDGEWINKLGYRKDVLHYLNIANLKQELRNKYLTK